MNEDVKRLEELFHRGLGFVSDKEINFGFQKGIQVALKVLGKEVEGVTDVTLVYPNED